MTSFEISQQFYQINKGLRTATYFIFTRHTKILKHFYIRIKQYAFTCTRMYVNNFPGVNCEATKILLLVSELKVCYIRAFNCFVNISGTGQCRNYVMNCWNVNTVHIVLKFDVIFHAKRELLAKIWQNRL